MIFSRRNRAQTRKPVLYATSSDFEQIFSDEAGQLYQLAYLLTRDHEKAERCFVAGLEDCVNDNAVFAEWARSWAKRTIIQNAIRELKPAPKSAEPRLTTAIFPYVGKLSSNGETPFELSAVLALDDFERFVFVISVLEHYSDQDCSLLLGCSRQEIGAARVRALVRLSDSRPMILSDEISSQSVLTR